MNKSKVLKETAWFVGIALGYGAYIYLMGAFCPEWTNVLGTFYLIWWINSETLSLNWMDYLQSFLILSFVIEVIALRILFFYALKFKWKLLACLMAFGLFVLMNAGAARLGLFLMLHPHWQTYQNDQYHFSMESPYRMAEKKSENAGPAQFEASGPVHLCQVSVRCTGSRNETLEQKKSYWQKEAGKENVSSTFSSGIPAILVNYHGFYCLEVINGDFSWTFTIGYKNHFEEYYRADTKAMAERIIKSIRIMDVGK